MLNTLSRPIQLLIYTISSIALYVANKLGYKTVLITYRFSYFDSIVSPIIKALPSNNLVIRICRERHPNLFKFSKYLNHNKFLATETSGIHFPCSWVKSERQMFFHGLGVYNLDAIKHNLQKFDTYFIPNKYFKRYLPAGEVVDFGYPKLDSLKSKINGQDDCNCNGSLVYIAHWLEGASFFNNFEKIKTFSSSYTRKKIILHSYFKVHYDQEILNKMIHEYKKIGFEVLFEYKTILEQKNVTYLIDTHSSSFLEASLLNLKLFGIDNYLYDDEISKIIRKKEKAPKGEIFQSLGEYQEMCFNLGCSAKVLENY